MLKYLAHAKCKISNRFFFFLFCLKISHLGDLEESLKQGINVKMFLSVSFFFKKKKPN